MLLGHAVAADAAGAAALVSPATAFWILLVVLIGFTAASLWMWRRFDELWRRLTVDVSAITGNLLLAVAVMMVAFWARLFALRVQDRVIRLEMRLRLLQLVPALAPRLGEFTINQLCSLRFASDAELPALAERVLAERLDDRKAIKRMIKDWEADLLRA